MTTLLKSPAIGSEPSAKQYATFYVGDLLLGVDIHQVQEINRQLDVTSVPGAPDFVRGVINLRGDVATVVDLRTLLGLAETEKTRDTRNLIVHSGGEAIGLWVDRISDILEVSDHEINPTPTNLDGIDNRFFIGVYLLETELVVLLDIDQLLTGKPAD